MERSSALPAWKRLKLQMLFIVYRDQNGDVAVLSPEQHNSVAMFRDGPRPRTVYMVTRGEEVIEAAESSVTVAERVAKMGPELTSLIERVRLTREAYETRLRVASRARENLKAI